jgi:hypothetical protein
VVLALALRLWGLTFGLPYGYHYDEHFYINAALQLGVGNIHYEPYTPRGLSNLEAIEFGGFYILGRVFRLFTSAAEFERLYRTDPTIFYLLGRLTAALLGAASVIPLFFLGRIVAGQAAGLLAAGLLAISFGHARESHYAVPDAPLVFFVTAAVALSVFGASRKRPRLVYLGAFAGGLAMALKWPALAVLPVPLLAIFVIQSDTTPGLISRLLNRSVVATLLCFGLGFAIGSPQVLVDPLPYFQWGSQQAVSGEAGGYGLWQIDTLPGWLFYAKMLYYQVGPVLLGLSLAGVMWSLVRLFKARDRISGLVLVFPLLYYLLMGATRHYFARYTLPLMPFMALFAAQAILGATAWARAKGRVLGAALAGALILASVALPLGWTIRHDILLSREDTRTIAKDWIEANIPGGAKIATDWRIYGPPLATPERPLAGAKAFYDLTYVEGIGLADRTIAQYREQGFDYIVASSYIDDISLTDPQWDAKRRAFYARLDQELEQVQEFRPYATVSEPGFVFDEMYGPLVNLGQRERPGPTIKVYRVK